MSKGVNLQGCKGAYNINAVDVKNKTRKIRQKIPKIKSAF